MAGRSRPWLALLCTEPPRVEAEWDGKTFFVAIGDRVLPQGACTSPAITNALCRRLDRRLVGLVRRHDFTYTRYADDLTFSGDRPAVVGRLLAERPVDRGGRGAGRAPEQDEGDALGTPAGGHGPDGECPAECPSRRDPNPPGHPPQRGPPRPGESESRGPPRLRRAPPRAGCVPLHGRSRPPPRAGARPSPPALAGGSTEGSP